MRQFAEICEAVAATRKKIDKMLLVGDYLRSLPLEDATRAALFFTGRAFPKSTEDVTQVGGKLIWSALSAITGANAREMSAAYRRYGDLGGAAQELLAGKTENGSLTLAEAEQAFRDLATAHGLGPKLEKLTHTLRRLPAVEAKYFIKILTGELRIGLNEGLVEEALGRGFGQPLADVQRAHMLTGDIGETLRLAATNRLAD